MLLLFLFLSFNLVYNDYDDIINVNENQKHSEKGEKRKKYENVKYI